jgi:hypothetical protein
LRYDTTTLNCGEPHIAGRARAPRPQPSGCD